MNEPALKPARSIKDLLDRVRRWLNHEIELPNLKRGRDEAKAREWLEYDWSKDSKPPTENDLQE